MQSSPATRLPANTRGGRETILLAEDDKIIIEMAKSILERTGYTVLTAMDGEEALEVFHAHKDEIALIILDVVMPKIGGEDASEKIHALRSGIPILFTSGYSAFTLDLLSAPEGCVRFLAKPYSIEDLLTAVRELLDKPAQD
jgi:CheY-like chemotaxis protein